MRALHNLPALPRSTDTIKRPLAYFWRAHAGCVQLWEELHFYERSPEFP